jgi:hypothetical protein
MGLYTPTRADDPELTKIAQAISSPDDYKQFNELDRLPVKYRDGTELFMSAALATTLGLAGRGKYIYYGGAWNRLG